LPPLAGEADTGRVLVIRDGVEELRPNAVGKSPLELVDLEPVLVHRHRHELRFETAERHDRAEVRRPLDDDRVAAIEERLADELQRFDRATRDQQLVVSRTAAFDQLEPVGKRVERARDATSRRVLKGGRLTRRRELLEERGSPLAWERQRIREATRERDQVGNAEQSEDLCDPFADVPAGACREEGLPA
jgi:hypothetical protein